MHYDYYQYLCSLRQSYPNIPISQAVQPGLSQYADHPEQLALHITSDPLSTAATLAFAHQKLITRSNSVTTISKILMLLGTGHIIQHLQAQQTVHTTIINQQYALCCAQMAQKVAEARTDINPPEIKLAALLLWVPAMMLSDDLASIPEDSPVISDYYPWLENQLELCSFLCYFWQLSPVYGRIFHPIGIKQAPRTQTIAFSYLLAHKMIHQQSIPEQWQATISESLRIPPSALEQILDEHKTSYPK